MKRNRTTFKRLKLIAGKVTLSTLLACSTIPLSASAQTGAPTYQAYPMQNVNAQSVIQTLQQNLGGRAEVSVDAARNQILVKGAPDVQQNAFNLVRQLDRQQQSNPVRPASTNGLNQGGFNQASPMTVQNYLAPQGQLDRIAGLVRGSFSAQANLAVLTNVQTNEVQVRAPETVQRDVINLLQLQGVQPSSQMSYIGQPSQPVAQRPQGLQGQPAQQPTTFNNQTSNNQTSNAQTSNARPTNVAVAPQVSYPPNQNYSRNPASTYVPTAAPFAQNVPAQQYNNSFGSTQSPTQFASAPVSSVSLGAGMTIQDQRTYRLQNISVLDFENDIRRTWGERLQVRTLGSKDQLIIALPAPDGVTASMIVDRKNNVIFFNGPENIIASWRRAVEALDVTRGNSNEDVRWLALDKADPSRVRKAVSYLQLASKENPQGEFQSVIAPGNGAQPSGGQLVASMFQKKNLTNANSVSVVQVPGGQPPATGQDGQPTNPQDPDAAGDEESGGLYGPVQLFFIEELGIIIVKGNPRDVERVNAIIQEIEDLSRLTVPEVILHPLKFAESTAIARVVQELYDAVYANRQGPVTITDLINPNALMIVGRREAVDFVKGLIEKLDVPVEASSEFRVFRLKYMSAIDMEARLNSFYNGVTAQGQTIQGQEARLGLGTRVRVTSDYRSNSLIIQASQNALEEVQQLIDELDRPDTGSSNEVKIFPLKNALAEELGPVIQDALNGQLQGSGRSDLSTTQQNNQQLQNQRAMVRAAMLHMKITGPDGEIVQGSIMYDVRVTWDTNRNALIVTGPSEGMELISELIAQLDSLPQAETKIKVFTLVHADATNAQTLLENLFDAGGGVELPLQTASVGDNSTLVSLRFSADVRTNTIIASGSEADLGVIETLLLRIDTEEVGNQETRVYQLRNAISDDTATAINAWITNLGTAMTDQAGFNTPEEVASIGAFATSEPVTNSLIVNATPEFFPNIESVIDQLDRRPPMVMIQCLIADVDLGNLKEFGVEAGIQDSIWFTRGSGDIGFPFNSSRIGNNSDAASLATQEFLVGQALSNLAVGRTNASVGAGGMVLSAGNESVNLLLRALEQRTRVEVLARPQIMTLNRLTAEVQDGQTISRITGNNLTGNGVSQTIVTPTEVGIILNVTPEVSLDGMVTLAINATRSKLGDEATGTVVSIDENGNAVRSPPIDKQTIQTSVMCKSGQTVVLGGLISNTETEVMRGIPWVSDIPVIGRAFRFDSLQQARSELIFVMTPYIVNDDESLEMINRMEMDRMSWCMANVAAVHGSVGYDSSMINFEQAVPTIRPDQDPTGKGTSSVGPAPLPIAPVKMQSSPIGEGETEMNVSDPQASYMTPSGAFIPRTSSLPSAGQRLPTANANLQQPVRQPTADGGSFRGRVTAIQSNNAPVTYRKPASPSTNAAWGRQPSNYPQPNHGSYPYQGTDAQIIR